MGFPRQEYCSRLPFPSSGDHPNPGLELMSPVSPALACDPGLELMSPVSPALACGLFIIELSGKSFNSLVSLNYFLLTIRSCDNIYIVLITITSI